ncbi:MAG: DUF2007 domain-containing protein [Flavobacteriaceae bacterium]|nr:DUF2007 domain-containing protein [Flavobacteriaceae bacterium]
MNLITIKVFDSSPEAYIFKSKLDSLGINSYIFDEHINSLDPIMSNAFGGIKLKINKEDYEQAISIFSEIENAAITDDDNNILKCPKCESTKLYTGFKSMKGGWGFLSAIVSFIFMVFPIHFKYVYKCKKCGEEFQKETI